MGSEEGTSPLPSVLSVLFADDKKIKKLEKVAFAKHCNPKAARRRASHSGL